MKGHFKKYSLLVSIIIVYSLLIIADYTITKELYTPLVTNVSFYKNENNYFHQFNPNYVSENEDFFIGITLENKYQFPIENIYILINGEEQKFVVDSSVTIEHYYEDQYKIYIPMETGDLYSTTSYKISKIEYSKRNTYEEVEFTSDTSIAYGISMYIGLSQPIVNKYEISYSHETNNFTLKLSIDEPSSNTGEITELYIDNKKLEPKSYQNNIYTFEFSEYPDSRYFGFYYDNGRQPIRTDIGILPFPSHMKIWSTYELTKYKQYDKKPIMINGQLYYVVEVMNNIHIYKDIIISNAFDYPFYFIKGSNSGFIFFEGDYNFIDEDGNIIESNIFESEVYYKNY